MEKNNVIELIPKYEADFQHLFWNFYKISYPGGNILVDSSNGAKLVLIKLFFSLYVIFTIKGKIHLDVID